MIVLEFLAWSHLAFQVFSFQDQILFSVAFF